MKKILCCLLLNIALMGNCVLPTFAKENTLNTLYNTDSFVVLTDEVETNGSDPDPTGITQIDDSYFYNEKSDGNVYFADDLDFSGMDQALTWQGYLNENGTGFTEDSWKSTPVYSEEDGKTYFLNPSQTYMFEHDNLTISEETLNDLTGLQAIEPQSYNQDNFLEWLCNLNSDAYHDYSGDLKTFLYDAWVDGLESHEKAIVHAIENYFENKETQQILDENYGDKDARDDSFLFSDEQLEKNKETMNTDENVSEAAKSWVGALSSEENAVTKLEDEGATTIAGEDGSLYTITLGDEIQTPENTTNNTDNSNMDDTSAPSMQPQQQSDAKDLIKAASGGK